MVLWWIEMHPGLAAWVQAVGTVVALAVAVGLPILERKRTEHAAALAMQTPLRFAMISLFHAKHYYAGPANTPAREKLLSETQTHLEQLRAAPIDKLDVRSMLYVRQFVHIITQLERALGDRDHTVAMTVFTRNMGWGAVAALRRARAANKRIVEEDVIQNAEAFFPERPEGNPT